VASLELPRLRAPGCSQAVGWLLRGLLVRPTTAVMSTVDRDTGRMFTLGLSTVHRDAGQTFTPLTTAAQATVDRIILPLETIDRRELLVAPKFVVARAEPATPGNFIPAARVPMVQAMVGRRTSPLETIGPLERVAPQFVAARAAGPVAREVAGTASRLT